MRRCGAGSGGSPGSGVERRATTAFSSQESVTSSDIATSPAMATKSPDQPIVPLAQTRSPPPVSIPAL